MKIEGMQDIMEVSYLKNMIKKTVGDGIEADYAFEVIMNSLNEENNTSNKSESNTVVEFSKGRRLDDSPMILRKNNDENLLINVKELNNYVNNLKSTDEIEVNTVEELTENSLMDKIYSTVDKYANKYNVDRNLILGIIKQESNFDPNVESYAGAKGLMQLMDFNSETFGISNPFDIEENIEGGVKLLRNYLDMFDDNVEMALMAYNGGPGTMERRGVTSSSDLYKMPEETQNYVPKVMSNYNSYRNS